MIENIKKPTGNTIPNEVPKVDEPLVEKNELAPQPKNPDHSGIGDLKQRTMADGSFRVYELAPGDVDDPAFQVVRKALGLDDGQASQQRNNVAEITKLLCTLLQDDRPEVLIANIRRLARFSPQSGKTFHILQTLKEVSHESR